MNLNVEYLLCGREKDFCILELHSPDLHYGNNDFSALSTQGSKVCKTNLFALHGTFVGFASQSFFVVAFTMFIVC